MPLPTPARFCSICGDKIQGRSDKIFCSLSCKNQYHHRRKLEYAPFSYPVDKILNRNWVILQEEYEKAGKRKFFISKALLNKSGFHTQYFTTTQKNKQGKEYKYVYNFGWMDFSNKEVMVVRLNKSK